MSTSKVIEYKNGDEWIDIRDSIDFPKVEVGNEVAQASKINNETGITCRVVLLDEKQEHIMQFVFVLGRAHVEIDLESIKNIT